MCNCCSCLAFFKFVYPERFVNDGRFFRKFVLKEMNMFTHSAGKGARFRLMRLALTI